MARTKRKSLPPQVGFVLTSIYFFDFVPLFSAFDMRSYIKPPKECFIRCPNTSKWIKNTWLRLVFQFTSRSRFEHSDETFFLVFDLLHLIRPYSFRFWLLKGISFLLPRGRQCGAVTRV